MVYIQTVMTAEKATTLGHDHVTHCFVDIQSFSRISRISSAELTKVITEMNETQGYATESLQIIHYFTRYADANQLSRGLPFHCMSSSVADKSHVHTRIEQCGFQDNLSGFNSLNQNVRIVACRQWGDSRV